MVGVMQEYTLSGLRWLDLLSPNDCASDCRVSETATEEIALQWAVFIDGLQRYWALASDIAQQDSEEFTEEEAWILDDDHTWPFSFVNLCKIFGFHADSVRSTLLAHKEAHYAARLLTKRNKKPLRGTPHL